MRAIPQTTLSPNDRPLKKDEQTATFHASINQTHTALSHRSVSPRKSALVGTGGQLDSPIEPTTLHTYIYTYIILIHLYIIVHTSQDWYGLFYDTEFGTLTHLHTCTHIERAAHAPVYTTSNTLIPIAHSPYTASLGYLSTAILLTHPRCFCIMPLTPSRLLAL